MTKTRILDELITGWDGSRKGMGDATGKDHEFNERLYEFYGAVNQAAGLGGELAAWVLPVALETSTSACFSGTPRT